MSIYYPIPLKKNVQFPVLNTVVKDTRTMRQNKVLPFENSLPTYEFRCSTCSRRKFKTFDFQIVVVGFQLRQLST